MVPNVPFFEKPRNACFCVSALSCPGLTVFVQVGSVTGALKGSLATARISNALSWYGAGLP